MKGKLYIVGVGPGDPDLVSVRAAAVLARVPEVFVPVSRPGRQSVAYEIAKKHIAADATVTECVFSMSGDKQRLYEQYVKCADSLLAAVDRHADAALITLGDPGTYSTSWPVVELIRQSRPYADLEIVPGITAFAAGSSHAIMSLAEGNDVLSVISSYDSPQRIETVVNTSDTVVFLKTYSQRAYIVSLLQKMGVSDQCVYVQRCGLEGELVTADLKHIPDEKEYLSMIILKKKT